MRKIQKTEAPQSFIDFCNKYPDMNFIDLPSQIKAELRERLLQDQGYICCYCGRLIDNNIYTKIEHIKPQSKFPDLAMNYDNMLASCDGGDQDRRSKVKKDKHGIHCDAKKGNCSLPVSPLEDIEGLFRYFADGTVKGTGEGKEIINILGLDTPFLVNERKAAFASYLMSPIDNWSEEYERLSRRKDNGKFTVFCFVLQSYIKHEKLI